MNAPQIPLDKRPDIVAMAGPDYDLASETPAAKTLILCSAPRTGSYELCRYLMAAGVGIPHEYFHPDFARDFGPRFGIEGNPLDGSNVQPYIEALRRYRGQNGVLAINLQYWQLSGALLNGSGNSLFKDAAIVHLFRSDVGNQVTSWRVAMNTGLWDHSRLRTAEGRPFPDDIDARIQQYEEDLKLITGEDTNFREFFALAGIDPYFVTMKELFADPAGVVHKIAKLLDAPVNENTLKAMIGWGRPYPRNEEAYKRATEGLAERLRHRAFRQE